MKQNDKIKYFRVVRTPILCPHFPLNMWQVFYSQIQVADALSHALPHFCWQEFWHLVPDTQPLPISIPQNSWQNWRICLRAAMLLLSKPRPCSFYMVTACLSPSTVYFLLLSAWKATILGFSLPSWRMDFVPLCHISGQKIQHSSIKFCLFRVRAFHTNQGFQGPLANCLCLQQVVFGSLSPRSPHVLSCLFTSVLWLSVHLRVHSTQYG